MSPARLSATGGAMAGNQWGEGRPLRMHKGGSIQADINRDGSRDMTPESFAGMYGSPQYGFPSDLTKVPNNPEDTQGNSTMKNVNAPEDARMARVTNSAKKSDAFPGGGW